MSDLGEADVVAARRNRFVIGPDHIEHHAFVSGVQKYRKLLLY
jgi:hypothetical protein